jgi:DNA-binding beta-propeller fold protein YncE
MSKTIRLTVLASLALVWICVSARAQGGVTNSTKNPKQIAILHWYPANLTTLFSNVTSAVDVFSDGTNIWTTTTDRVFKVRPSDGTVLGSFGPLSAGPGAMAFDGANVWISAIGAGLLDKVRASDGAILGHFGGGGGSILFDGTNIWSTNGSRINNLIKVRPSDGTHLATFTIGPGVCQGTSGLAFDGANIWVAYSGCDINGAALHTVTKMRASDGTVLGTFPVGGSPEGVLFDGTNIWVANNADNTLSKLRASDGVVLGTFPAGTFPEKLAFDGTNIWATNHNTTEVVEVRASDGALTIFQPGGFPKGITFDGTNIWLSSGIGLEKL